MYIYIYRYKYIYLHQLSICQRFSIVGGSSAARMHQTSEPQVVLSVLHLTRNTLCNTLCTCLCFPHHLASACVLLSSYSKQAH